MGCTAPPPKSPEYAINRGGNSLGGRRRCCSRSTPTATSPGAAQRFGAMPCGGDSDARRARPTCCQGWERSYQCHAGLCFASRTPVRPLRLPVNGAPIVRPSGATQPPGSAAGDGSKGRPPRGEVECAPAGNLMHALPVGRSPSVGCPSPPVGAYRGKTRCGISSLRAMFCCSSRTASNRDDRDPSSPSA